MGNSFYYNRHFLFCFLQFGGKLLLCGVQYPFYSGFKAGAEHIPMHLPVSYTHLLKWNERVLTVRGVFSERADVLLVADEMTGTFTAAELGGALEEDRRTQAQTLVQQAGLPAPDSMIYGQSMYTLALWFCYLPMVLASVFWIKGCRHRIHALPPAHRQVLWWGVGMGTALCLPFLLSLLPVWMIPARWSDFSFWPTLLQTGGQCIDEWLALVLSLIHI